MVSIVLSLICIKSWKSHKIHDFATIFITAQILAMANPDSSITELAWRCITFNNLHLETTVKKIRNEPLA